MSNQVTKGLTLKMVKKLSNLLNKLVFWNNLIVYNSI